jgi:hypothetical protein
MKNVNIGIVNLMVSDRLKNSYFNNRLIGESKKLTFDFFNIVKESPILQLEFRVFDNIENKHIENDLIATRYIDNNIKLFEVYTIEEIDREREKLIPFINEGQLPVNSEKVQIYNAIDDLINESLNDYDKIDVDSIHESFNIVLNHIKKPKRNVVESVGDILQVNDEIIEIAVDKFNEKYNSLNEDDKNLLQKLIKSTEKEKEALLETYKKEDLVLLEGINKDSVKEKVTKAINKIREMIFKKETVDDDIISLHELKKELL